MRAPTPTAAAELAVPVRLELLQWCEAQDARLARAVGQAVAQRAQRVRDLGRALPQVESLLDGPRQRLDFLAERLPAGLRAVTASKRIRLADAGLRPGVLRRAVAEDRRRFEGLAARLAPALGKRVAEARRDLGRVQVKAPDLARRGEQVQALLRRLSDRATRQQAERAARLAALDRLRETLGYRETLKRGYAVVRGDGAVVTGVDAAARASRLAVEFADGVLPVVKG